MITLYEHHGLTIDEDLVGQYLQDSKIAKNFAVYYDLFNKYRSDYQVEEILAGNTTEEIKERAGSAGFDERLSLIGLLLDAVTDEVKTIINGKKELEQLMQILKQFRVHVSKAGVLPFAVLEALKADELKKLDHGRKAGSLSIEKQSQTLSVIDILDQYLDLIVTESDGMNAFALLKMDFDNRVKQLKQSGQEKGILLENLFIFVEEVFNGGHELLIVVTELTTNPYTAKYISEYGCEKYFAHNQELLFYERQKKLMQNIQELNLGDIELLQS
jgi:hypothetical protein